MSCHGTCTEHDKQKSFFLQDSFAFMTKFSAAWKKHGLLYDSSLRDNAFKRDYKGTVDKIRRAYEEIAKVCETSVGDVKQ